MQQSWQGETAQVGEGIRHPQSLCASPPEAVLPAERQAAVQAWDAGRRKHLPLCICRASRNGKQLAVTVGLELLLPLPLC